jgi:hypothetical protein
VISLRRIQLIFAIWGCLVSLTAWADAAPTGAVGNAWEDPRNPVVRTFGGQRLDLWSLRPVVLRGTPSAPVGLAGNSRVSPTSVSDAPLDAWLGRPSAPEADPRTLIRRVTLDLTGLPPSIDEVESFERQCVQEVRSDGQGASLARAMPAGNLVRAIAGEMRR